MDSTCRTRTLQTLYKGMEKGTIMLTHKLQRPEGQWNKRQKSDLIDSMLRKYPINPTYAIKEDDTLSVIDGVQRLSCIRDFLSDKFSLSIGMDPVTINGEFKNLSGMRFSKMDDDTKEAILSSELQIYELTDCTDKDVREIFRRQNAGKPLTKKHLHVVHESDEFSEKIQELTAHPFMDKIMTMVYRKNGTDREVIIETLMLIESIEHGDYLSFRGKDVDDFIVNHADSIEQEKYDMLTKALDKLDEHYIKIKIPVTSMPMVLFGGYYTILKDGKFDAFCQTLDKFLKGYESDEQYKKYIQNGTSNYENVKGRYDYWKKLVGADKDF